MSTLSINEILYGPPPHWEIEPPAPLPAWMLSDDDEDLPLLEDEDEVINEEEENEVHGVVQEPEEMVLSSNEYDADDENDAPSPSN